MRQTLMVAVMAVMMSCGADGNSAWDLNHDGLITPCEGLNSRACDSTPGCEPVAAACDTHSGSDSALREVGSNTPCVGAETCQPTTPPIFDCSRLPLSDCATVARCEVVTRETACATGGNGAGFAESDRAFPAPPCGQAVQVCVNRAPAACEQLSNDVCLAQPGCALAGADATCDVSCSDSGNGFSCPVCATPQLHCVTVPPPDVCGARDENTCAMDGRCVLEVSDVRYESGGGATPCFPGDQNCGAPAPCSPPAPRCVPAPPPDVCGSRDENTCSLDGQCVLETLACATVCSPDGSCPPCPSSTVCVPARPPEVCGSRDENTCGVDGQCVLIPGPECLCTPDGFCPPCASPSVMCVPAPVTDCSSRDLNTCSFDGQCMVMAWACPAVCKPDGQGGCEPCDVPAASCVPVSAPAP